MSDRGMKKFAPYASLIEQNDYLERMRYEKNKIEKPKLSSEKAEEIGLHRGMGQGPVGGRAGRAVRHTGISCR